MTAVGMGTIGPSTVAASAVLLLLAVPIASLELGLCGNPLGMESGVIKDFAITASSAYDSGSVGPQHGRLRNDKNGGAWCPRHMVSQDAKEYLEINLEELFVITGGRTQGRFGNGQGQEYAEEYMIDYWRPGFAKWVRWRNRNGKELLSGNTNTYTVVDQKLDPPVIATKLRFLPYSDHVRTVCMRVELLGCKFLDGLLSYSGPQGVKRGPELDLSDRTYDGREEGGYLSHGLGQLVDGQKGQDNFRLDIAGHGKGYEWVGWRNDTPGLTGHPLELLFEFDKVRNFSAAHLHTNNLYTKDVQVFSRAKIYFSIGGNLFNGEPVHFSYMPDLVLEHARNVTIKLHHRVGRFLKLQLYFASRWILLSEISFDSAAVSGNYTDGEEDIVIPDAGKEYPLQRDEVKTTSTKVNRNATGASTKGGSNEEPKQYIGFIIGILTVVILILVAAIVFIVIRNQRLKAAVKRTKEDPFVDDLEDKAPPYQESCRPGASLPSTHSRSPDYAEVPDVICQDYAVPDYPRSGKSRGTPPVLNFLPKPPPIPPPPERYYENEICNHLPVSPSPPMSPPSSGGPCRPRMNCQYMLPLNAEQDDCDEDDVKIEVFPREQLLLIEKLGEGRFSDVHICEVQLTPNDRWGLSDCKLVVVNTLKFGEYRSEFTREAHALARLRDANIARLLGACFDSEPVCAVREYAEMGDLCQFLQNHVAETATPLTARVKTLSYGCLIYMATQIASGMKYLESVRFVHKDLATRNCLVARRYSIKISDLGAYRQTYCSDYCQLEGSGPQPVRWMAWESILLGKFSTKGDVWAFAVTLWEILTFAREQPFEELSDEKVIENASHYYQDNGEHMTLDAPINCPKEIFDLMCHCWQRIESKRPNFREIHLFLQRKNLGYAPDLH